MNSIQIIFPLPGNWHLYKIISRWADAEGYELTSVHRTVPVEYQGIMQQVVGLIVGLEAPWQARLVVASLRRLEPEPEVDAPFEPSYVVELAVHARRNADGAAKVFTSADYPQLRFADEQVMAFFRHFSHGAPV